MRNALTDFSRHSFSVGDQVPIGRYVVEINEVVDGYPVAVDIVSRGLAARTATSTEFFVLRPRKCPRRVLRFVTAGLLAALHGDADEMTRDRLACRLAASSDTRVRVDLVRESSLGDLALTKLSKDWWWEVRAGVAVHPRASLELLMELANDESAWVRRAVAERKDAPTLCLDLLADDVDLGVRDAVAEHPNCPRAAMARLSQDARWEIRRSIAKRPDAPPEILVALAKDPETWVRFFVATNVNTPPGLLEGFASDESRALRISSQKRRGALLRPVTLFLSLDSRTAAQARRRRRAS